MMTAIQMVPATVNLVWLAIFCFTVAVLGCLVGLFYARYQDNWLQHIGLICAGLASALKIQQIHHRGFVTPETALLAVGVACFALGVAFKVWEYQRRERRYTKPKAKKRVA